MGPEGKFGTLPQLLLPFVGDFSPHVVVHEAPLEQAAALQRSKEAHAFDVWKDMRGILNVAAL